ncbi:hypothetical protein OIU78_002693 [Salix suchowensis]|nr:hypothetical protein OIU78_002693 [Salix suchowensis]
MASYITLFRLRSSIDIDFFQVAIETKSSWTRQKTVTTVSFISLIPVLFIYFLAEENCSTAKGTSSLRMSE